MADESIFKKVDGDILHASEVNGFYAQTGSPFFQHLGSGFTKQDGTVNNLVVGSILFTGVTGLCLVNISYVLVEDGNTGLWNDNSYISGPTIGKRLFNKSPSFGASATENVLKSETVQILENTQYVFNMERETADNGSLLIGSVTVFGGHPGITASINLNLDP